MIRKLHQFLKLEIDFKARIFGLDLLRALAILFVVYDHGIELIKPIVNVKLYNIFVFDGVSMFFVLSGFLIGGILIKTAEKEEFTFEVLFNFWKRRWLRTVPNYFIVLTLLVIIKLLRHSNDSLEQFIPYILFSQNIYLPHPDFFPEAWSISIEEWFYISLPLFCFTIIKTKLLSVKHTILFVAIFFSIFSIYFRMERFDLYSPNNFELYDKFFRKQVFTRLDSIAFGVIGAYFRYYKINFFKRYKYLFFYIGVSLFILPKIINVLSINNFYYEHVFSFSISSISVLFMLPFLYDLRTPTNKLSYLFITYISLISYSLYLIHLSFIQGILNQINFENNIILVFKYFFYWVLSLSIAFVMYKYLEISILKFRDRV